MSDGLVDVGMGKLTIAEAPSKIVTSGVGSCVAICLYSKTQRVGALAHIMLPTRPDGIEEISEVDFKYADVALSVLVEGLREKNVQKSEIVAKIAGGANMFPGIEGRSQKVGEKNVDKIRELLKAQGIPLSAEEVGGSSGRSISFDLNNGIVTITKTI